MLNSFSVENTVIENETSEIKGDIQKEGEIIQEVVEESKPVAEEVKEPVKNQEAEEPEKIEEEKPVEKEVEPEAEVVEPSVEEEVNEEMIEVSEKQDEESSQVEDTPAFELVETKPVEEKTEAEVITAEDLGPSLHEAIQQSKETLHDIIGKFKSDTSLATKLQNKPISNIKTAVSINDKIMYINELFNGDSKLWDEVIDALNTMDNLDNALTYIDKRFGWEEENDTIISFLELIYRRFLPNEA
jgi:hypothetical protein